MTVLIGGGTGFIGRHLASRLRTKGYKITLISRHTGQNHVTWGEIQNRGLPEGTEVVVNLAGKNVMTARTRFETIKSEVYMSRIDTTRLLAQKIAESANPPKVWISASAVGFYPVSETAKYTEYSPGGDNSFLSNLCVDWEHAAKLPASSDVRHVTIRIGVALGRDGGVIHNMFIPFFFGVGGRLGDGRQWFPWIHVDDVAGLINHVIDTPSTSGVLNAVSPELVTNAQFTKVFAKSLSRPSAFTQPAWLLRSMFAPERAELLLKGQCVIPQRTLESGYNFMYPDLESACREFCRLPALY